MAVSVRDLDSDAALVRGAQAGDNEAFAELFRRHYPSVRRACARRLGSLLDGEEVAQAAFVRAWERIDQCEGDRRFGGWVQVIAQRLCFDGLRDRGRTTPSDTAVDSPTSVTADVPEDALLRSETTALVHRALRQLPPRQRDVVVARDLHDRRAPEIAASLGLSVGAVDSLLLRGRRRLAEALTRMGGERGATTASSSVMATAAATSARLPALAQSIQSAIERVSYSVAAALGVVPGAASQMQRAVGAALVAGTIATGVSAVPSAPAVNVAVPPAVVAAVPGPAPLPLPAPAAPTPPVAAATPAVPTPAPPAITAPPAPAAPVSPAPAVPVAGGGVSHTIAGLAGRLGLPVGVGNLAW